MYDWFKDTIKAWVEAYQAEMAEKTGSTFKQMHDVLHVADGWIFEGLIRDIGGMIINLLAYINIFVEDIVMKIITMGGFYESQPVQEFMQTIRPIVWGLFGLAIVILGFQFMFGKIKKRNDIVMNILLALCFLVVIPDLVSNLDDITDAGIEAINPKTETLASNLIKTNILDIAYYADNGFQFSERKNGDENLPPKPQSKALDGQGTTNYKFANKLSEDSIFLIDYSQKLYGDEDKDDLANLILTNKMVASGYEDEVVYLKLSENTIPTTELGEEHYFRYHVNWLILFGSLIVTCFALIITIVKVGRLFFDIAFHQIFGMFVSVTDLSGGQRTKKILTELINSFAVLFIMVLLLKLFVLYATWVGGLQGNIGGIGVVILLIAGAWAIIDAPNIVERLLGIDAGLRSGYGSMVGAYAGLKMAGMPFQAASKGFRMANQTKNGITNLGSGLKGFSSGLKNGFKSEDQPTVPSNNNQSGNYKGNIANQFKEQTADNTPNNSNDRHSNDKNNDRSSINGNESTNTENLNTKQKVQNVPPVPGNNSSVTPRTVSNNTSEMQNEPSVEYSAAESNEVQQKNNPSKQHENGHIQAQHENTIMGNTKWVQGAKESYAKSHNSAYSIGKNLRKIRDRNSQEKPKREIENRGKKE